MRRLIWILVFLLSVPFIAIADKTTVVEIDVNGMTCAFCVEGLHKSLLKVPGVEIAEVSLKLNRARIEMGSKHKPDIEAIKRAIVNAGFTPGDVREIS